MEKLQKKSHHLDSLVESNNPENWFKVANSKYATESHLITIAKKCVFLESDKEKQVKIAKAIVKNSAITNNVMFILAKSHNPDIWILTWSV